MFKISLAIKGRNSVWASGVRRKSRCVRKEIKVKPQSFPVNHRQTSSGVFPRHPDGTFPEAMQKVEGIMCIFIRK